MDEDFWNESSEGDIHARDSLQFELKSEFFIHPQIKHSIYKQEIYIFIPNSLQINPETYSKQQFYLDETNLIRYKTPQMSFQELIDSNYHSSPLNRLKEFLYKPDSILSPVALSDELKLFAAIFRGAIREQVHHMLKKIKLNEYEKDSSELNEKRELLNKEIALLCSNISTITKKFRSLEEIALLRSNFPQVIRDFKTIDEFISLIIDEFMLILLKHVQTITEKEAPEEKLISQLIIKEKFYRKKMHLGPKTIHGHLFSNESILYRQGLLHRFVLEALMLKHVRVSSEEKHRNILGAIAAGIAMMVYMTLLAWNASTLVINSMSFIFLAAFLYVIKDRIKEGFKTLYFKRAHRWFPDYSTEMSSFKGFKVGKLTENFSFIEPDQLPHGFLNIRNHSFHEELQALHRHETIIQYKRELSLVRLHPSNGDRRHAVTIIFRLNIHRFLQNASNALQTHLALDGYTKEILEKHLPKVYHLNLIIRHSFLHEDLTFKTEIKTYRVVIDKNGIKRVEHITPFLPQSNNNQNLKMQ